MNAIIIMSWIYIILNFIDQVSSVHYLFLETDPNGEAHGDSEGLMVRYDNMQFIWSSTSGLYTNGYTLDLVYTSNSTWLEKMYENFLQESNGLFSFLYVLMRST